MLSFVPAVGKQFADLVDGVIGYALQNIFKPAVGFNAVHFASAQQAVQHTTSFGGLVAAGE